MLKKRVTSLILVCVMLISLLPVPVRADDDTYPQEGDGLLIQTDDGSTQPLDGDSLPQDENDTAPQEDEDAVRQETLEQESEDLSEQADHPLPQKDAAPLMRMGGLSLMQSSGNSAAQESDLARVEAEDGSFALDPTSDSTYCLRIYEDPYFDDILAFVQPYINKITTVCIGANVWNIYDSTHNPLSVFPNLAAYEVEAGNTDFLAIDDVLFQYNSNGTVQLLYYPPAKTTPFTLPETTVWIAAGAFNNVDQAEINVPGNLELAANSPISIAALRESDDVKVNIIPTDDVESVAILFQGESVESLPTLDTGDSRSLRALVEPADALPDVTWSSSNEAVATVDSNGTVTAVGGGSAIITATTVGLKELEHLSSSCTVQVRPQVTNVSITSEDGRTALIPHETMTLSASVAPEDANQGLIWSVSDPSVLSLNSSTGSTVTVTALSAGTTTVIAVSARYGTIQDTYDITVSTPVTGVTLSKSDFTLYLTNPVSETQQLIATVHPEDASNQRVSWSSSDDAVATVSSTGLVSAVSEGISVISVTTADGAFTASCAVTVQEVDVASLAIDPAPLTLRIDPALPTARYGQLSASLDPVNATDQDVTWASLHPEIATVDQNGKVTAVSGGEAIILVTSTHGTDGALVTAQCKVTVELGATSISIPEELALSLNKEGAASQATLTATLEPSTSTDEPNWTSSNEGVATVDSDGTVTAVSEGRATITVTCGSVKATCAVTVTDYQVKKFDTLPQSIRVKVSETETISAKLGPSHATNKEIVWTIDNGEVASLGTPTVAADGTSTVTVQGLKVGTATVTATSADNDSIVAACTVTVPEIKVESLQLGSETLVLYRNTPDGKSADYPPTATLTLTISPADTTNDVAWTNSSNGVVTLGNAQYETNNNVKTGTVTLTAADGGMSVITATADGQTIQCTVNVVVLATGITLGERELALVKGTSATLIPTILPENVNNRAVTWTSSNEAVATVDANGVVTAVAASGTATITATAKDGSGVSAACTVTAKPIAASGITLDSTSIVLEKGAFQTLTATVTPPSVTDSSVTWASADETIAKVDATGKVTAVNGGSTTITATTADGKFHASCEVAVTVTLTGLTLDRGTLTIHRTENSANTGTLIATVTPADTTAGSVTWVSSDPNTVAVENSTAIDKTSGEARVTLAGKKAGIATVTAWIGNFSRTCTVTVEQPAASITLDRTALALGLHKSGVNDSATLIATLDPPDSTDALEWSSNNESVATVDQNGVVTAVSAGIATITVSCGSVKATCAVTVTDYQIKSLHLESRLTLYLNGTEAQPSEQTLTLTIEPFDTQDTISWSNGDPDVVTLGTPSEVSNESGKTQTVKVTAKSAGKMVITATAANGVTARCTVTVEDLSVKSVSVTPKRLVLLKGEVSEALLAVIEPSTAANTAVTWRSSNNNVATVNNGVVTAIGVGEAEIIVTTVDGSKIDVCYVTVTPKSVERITLSKSSIDVFFRETEDRTQTLTATVTPGDATDPSIIWASNNETVATVIDHNDGTATVTLHAAGSAVITATSASNSSVSATCPVIVRAIRVTSIQLDKSSLELNPLEHDTLTATLTSDSDDYGPDDTTVTWSSSNESVATVSSTGSVTAVGAGTAVITARTADGGFVATCVVRVWQKVTGVALDQSGLSLNVGDRGTLTAMVSPSTAANKTVTWASSNPEIATVDAAGNVTALAAGTATITVTTEDQGKQDTCTITVANPVTGVTLDAATLTLTKASEPRTLVATVFPANAENATVTWTSSDSTIVNVDDEGNITAVAVGQATITATANGHTATCIVTVDPILVSSIAMDAALTLHVGETGDLTVAVNPDNAENRSLNWTSSDSTIATVALDGTVCAIKPGTALITATAADGSGKYAVCIVTVTEAVTGVSITEPAPSFDLNMGSTLTLHAVVESDGATDETVTWSSSNPAVATVSAHGVVTPIAPGTTSIEAATADGDYSDSRTVTVRQLATGITLSPGTLSLPVGKTAELTAALLGNPTNSNINWSVNGTAVRVNQNGVITAEEAGTATVTAVAADGSGVSKSCIVTVYAPVTEVAIKKDGIPVSSLTLTMVTDPAAQLNAATTGGSNVAVAWSSSNTSVATVDSSGLVSATGAGAATITVTATTGDVSVSKSCTVSVRKAVISADTTTMTLTPAGNAANVVFSPWAAGTSLIWNVSGSSITRAEGALNDSDKTYTISSLNNGVTTISWSKAEDARYEASSGEITVFSVYNPIAAVSVDRSLLQTGSALTASIDQANRTIRVAGYVSGDAEAYSLDGKLIFTPASGVIDGLSIVYSTSTVVAKLNDSVICTYTLDRRGIVSLPGNVNVKTTLVAEENTAVSSINLTNANISGEASVVSAARTAAGDKITEENEANVNIAVTLSPVSQKTGSVAGYNTVTLDITPQYTVTDANGDLIDSGTLSALPSAITIQVETAFQPTLIVHKHEDSVEYIPFTCIGPNESGLYTVSWQQSTFSEVEFLDEAAAQQYLAEQAKADEPTNPAAGGGITPAGGAGAPVGSAPAAAGGAQAAPAEVTPKAYADVSTSHWAAEAIAYASARGIMNGMGDGSFAPEAAASRAMIAQILFNLTPGKAADTQAFADAAGTWYDEAARWAASCGIVSGIDGSFRGDDAITREQLVTMLYRCAQFMGRDVSSEAADYDCFTDASSVSPWASDAMRWAVGSGLIQGIDNTLSPDTGATRAQIATIMMRFCESAVV